MRIEGSREKRFKREEGRGRLSTDRYGALLHQKRVSPSALLIGATHVDFRRKVSRERVGWQTRAALGRVIRRSSAASVYSYRLACPTEKFEPLSPWLKTPLLTFERCISPLRPAVQVAPGGAFFLLGRDSLDDALTC